MPSFEGALRRIPVVRFVIPFILGIIVAEESTPGLSPGRCLAVGITLACLLVATHFITTRTLKSQTLHGITCYAAFFFAGFGLASTQRQDYAPLPSSKDLQCVARVTDFPQEKDKTFKIPLEVFFVLEGQRWKQHHSKVIAYIKKDSLLGGITIGDELVVAAKVDPVKNFPTRGHFNYSNYLRHKHIYNQLYVNKGRWKLARKAGGFSLKILASEICARVNEIYISSRLPEQETAVLGALMLGVRSDMPAELLDAYSSTGAMHILAVSGLHVGILYLILSWILFFMRGRWLGAAKSAIIIACVWFYAFMTGFSPSIERAAIMFSLIALAQLLDRNNEIYNTLATTALVCLIIKPSDLYDIGFQLSFMAILGIVYLDKFAKAACNPRQLLAKKIHELVAVSISAQILTLPLSMYYFGQVPTYFLLTNLVAIPVSFIVMVLGTAVIPAFFIPGIIFSLVSAALGWFVWLQNFSILHISKLPYSSIHVDVSFPLMLTMYGTCVACFVCVEYMRFRRR